MRRLMRSVPHSVAVVTSAMPPYEGPESYRGMTVSSFNTVCLTPKIIVSFNIKRPSSTYDAIKASGKFNVHLMNGTIEGARIAARFARGNGQRAFVEEDAFDGQLKVSASLTKGGPPVLDSAQIMFDLKCDLHQSPVEVADHVIVLGEVLSFSHPKIGYTYVSMGLCYVYGKYRAVGRIQHLPDTVGP